MKVSTINRKYRKIAKGHFNGKRMHARDWRALLEVKALALMIQDRGTGWRVCALRFVEADWSSLLCMAEASRIPQAKRVEYDL